MRIDSPRAREVAKKIAPIAFVLTLAVMVEVRSSRTNSEAPASTEPSAAEAIDPDLRRLAIAVDPTQRPALVAGDVVDVYGTDPLTGGVMALGFALVVTEATDTRVVVAAPHETISVVAAHAGYGHFTIVGY